MAFFNSAFRIPEELFYGSSKLSGHERGVFLVRYRGEMRKVLSLKMATKSGLIWLFWGEREDKQWLDDEFFGPLVVVVVIV